MNIAVRVVLTLSIMAGITACTKKVGEDPLNHPKPPSHHLGFVGNFAGTVKMNESYNPTGWNPVYNYDTVFVDTIQISYQESSDDLAFESLYYFLEGGQVARKTGIYKVPVSGTYLRSPYESIIFRNDSLYYYCFSNVLAHVNILKIAAKRVKQ